MNKPHAAPGALTTAVLLATTITKRVLLRRVAKAFSTAH
jgi:hypothetical protein